MAEKFSLKDHLFNPETVAKLASEFSIGVEGFDAARFQKEVLAGFPERELMARLDWIADCLEAQLPASFPEMAKQLEASLPDRLDPELKDDDFGHFMHAVPGILAVRHGLEEHRERALTLIYEATQRFSMEFYIRPFLNRWSSETLSLLHDWAQDPNYHVRRLVSEGTRPRLPWAKAITLTHDDTMPLLDKIYADETRFVTRSVANHLNDLSRIVPDLVLERLATWKASGKQTAKEMDWITRHALRTLVKQGHPGAMAALGYRADLEVAAKLCMAEKTVNIGEALNFEVALTTQQVEPVMVDYRLTFARPGGKTGQKVFKLKATKTKAGEPLTLKKAHKLKGNATTFKLYPGPHLLTVQVNGQDVADAAFDLV